MFLTYKYRLAQRSYGRRLRRHATALNQVWNYDVAVQRQHERDWKASAPKKRWPSEYNLNAATAGTSRELGTHAGSIHEINRQFSQSRDKAKRSPRFRRSFGPRRSLGWVPFRAEDRKLSGNSIRFHGKTYRWFKDRSLPPIVKGGAFVEDVSGRWWVCLIVEVDENLPAGAGQIGIDLGLKHLAVTSDGEKIEAIRSYRQLESKLAVAQRSHNKHRVRAIHRKIKNIRADHLHKMSARFAVANRLIIVGNVSASQLVRTNLAKSILDAGWSTFRNQLRYKARRHGAEYKEVDECFTTQTCSHCGGCSSAGRPRGITGLGIREWRCSSCGTSHDRDVNAARNILALGLSAGPLGEGIGEARGR